jgi:Domain of unknown function (DUF397)
VNEATWRTSSYSGTGNCVEVGSDSTADVLIRDTKDRTGPVLEFTPRAWRTFTGELRTSA